MCLWCVLLWVETIRLTPCRFCSCFLFLSLRFSFCSFSNTIWGVIFHGDAGTSPQGEQINIHHQNQRITFRRAQWCNPSHVSRIKQDREKSKRGRERERRQRSPFFLFSPTTVRILGWKDGRAMMGATMRSMIDFCILIIVHARQLDNVEEEEESSFQQQQQQQQHK